MALRTDTRIYVSYQNLVNVFLVTSVDGGVFLPDYQGSPRPFAPCGYAGAQLQGAYGLPGEAKVRILKDK